MKQYVVRVFAVMAAVLLLSSTVMELNAHARAGGSGSMGGRSSRSYSRQTNPPPQQSQARQQYATGQRPYQQQAGGGFMRNMAGGMMGGILGSMLFSSLGGASGGASDGVSGGKGIGLFEILFLAGGGYLVYRFMKKKSAQSSTKPSVRG